MAQFSEKDRRQVPLSFNFLAQFEANQQVIFTTYIKLRPDYVIYFTVK